ncbi:MAG: Yip1 family protein [Amaricoccus sp.]|uniref:Yip1 family protein n=1 Tax=Amaricoccus sp. TaxID=1872485 RepID=UPI0039E5FBE4
MWGELIAASFLRPRAAARRVLALDLDVPVLLQAALLVTAVGMVLGYAALRLAPDAIDAVSASVLGTPLLGAVAQLAVMAVVVFLAARVGRLFGGVGDVRGALALVVWLNAMMVLLQAVQLVALALLPMLAAVVAIASIVWVLSAFACFVAELHGFRNAAVVLAGILATSVVLMLGVAILAAILGITPQEVS